MWKKSAAIAVLPFMVALAVPAHADINYPVFLQTLAEDGIVIGSAQAIQEGHAVCQLMAPPNGGSLWDAAQQVKSTHSDWTMSSALNFASRSVQGICPVRGSF